MLSGVDFGTRRPPEPPPFPCTRPTLTRHDEHEHPGAPSGVPSTVKRRQDRRPGQAARRPSPATGTPGRRAPQGPGRQAAAARAASRSPRSRSARAATGARSRVVGVVVVIAVGIIGYGVWAAVAATRPAALGRAGRRHRGHRQLPQERGPDDRQPATHKAGAADLHDQPAGRRRPQPALAELHGRRLRRADRQRARGAQPRARRGLGHLQAGPARRPGGQAQDARSRARTTC